MGPAEEAMGVVVAALLLPVVVLLDIFMLVGVMFFRVMLFRVMLAVLRHGVVIITSVLRVVSMRHGWCWGSEGSWWPRWRR